MTRGKPRKRKGTKSAGGAGQLAPGSAGARLNAGKAQGRGKPGEGRARRSRWSLVAAGAALALLGFAGLLAGRRAAGRPGSAPYRPIIQRWCREYGVAPDLAAAVLEAESSGRARAVSESGALGLMQLMPATAEACARELGLGPPSRGDLFRPELNIRLGVYYLSKLRKRFGGEDEFVIAAYHAGPTRVDGWRKRRAGATPGRGASAAKVVDEFASPATRYYVRKVMARWKELAALAAERGA